MNKPYLIGVGGPTQDQIKALQTLKPFIATPAYGSKVFLDYHNSMNDFTALACSIKMDYETSYTGVESLVQRARNTLANQFMNSNSTHLIYIDGDIGFRPWHPLELLLAQQLLIGAAYPKKEILWEKVIKAVQAGVTDPKMLEHICGAHTCAWIKEGPKSLRRHEPCPVDYLPTGFLCIERSALIRFAKAANEGLFGSGVKRYIDYIDHNNRIDVFFHCEVNEVLVYLSEDYWFCEKMKSIGIQPMLAPWIDLVHIGLYRYASCLFCSNGQMIHNFEEIKK